MQIYPKLDIWQDISLMEVFTIGRVCLSVSTAARLPEITKPHSFYLCPLIS